MNKFEIKNIKYIDMGEGVSPPAVFLGVHFFGFYQKDLSGNIKVPRTCIDKSPKRLQATAKTANSYN